MTVWDILLPLTALGLVLAVLFVPWVRGALAVVLGTRGRDEWW